MIEAILTIDDIPSKNTRAIVDDLCEKGITAVLFAIGRNVEKCHENALYAVKRGMIVGNHSYSHPAFSKISMEEAIREIETTESILDRLYEEANVKRTCKPFRFPYGDKGGEKKEALQAYLQKIGLSKLQDRQIPYDWYAENGLHQDLDTFWTFDFEEYQIREGSRFKVEDVFRKMENPHPIMGSPLLAEGARHILLLHAHDETEEQVPGYAPLFLEYAMQRDVRFVTPSFEKGIPTPHPSE